MALFGDFDVKFDGTYSYLYIHCDWSATQDVTNNTSTITLSAYLKYYILDMKQKKLTLSIDGSAETYTVPAIKTDSGEHTKLLATLAKTVTHESNGTKSVDLKVNMPITFSDGGTTYKNLEGTETVELDAIPRESGLSFTPTSFDIGSNVTVTINRNSPSFTHDIYIQHGPNDVFYDPINTSKITGTTYNWNTGNPLRGGGDPTLLQLMPANRTSFSATIKLRTWSGNTYIGDVDKTYTATMPENANTKPNASLSWAIHSGDAPAGINVPIQTLNRIDFTITASGKYNATIASVRVEFDGKVYTPTFSNGTASFTSDFITSSGSLAAKVVVTDSRGFTKTVTSQIEVTRYYSPDIVPVSGATSVELYRCDAFGNRAINGEYVYVKAARRYADTYIGSIRNTAAMYWRSRVSGTAWQDNWVTLLGDGGHIDDYDSMIFDANHQPAFFTKANAFDIEIMIHDSMDSTNSIVFSIPNESIPLHLRNGGDGIGIGRYADSNPNNTEHVMVGWDAYFDGDIYIKVNGSYVTLAQYIQSQLNS